MTGPSNGKNRLTFGGDPVTDKTRIPDHFFYLNIFISIGIEGKGILGNLLAFPTHSPAAFHKTRRNDCRQQGINPLPFGSDPVDARIRINPDFGFKSWTTFVWGNQRGQGTWRWRRCTLCDCCLVFSERYVVNAPLLRSLVRPSVCSSVCGALKLWVNRGLLSNIGTDRDLFGLRENSAKIFATVFRRCMGYAELRGLKNRNFRPISCFISETM